MNKVTREDALERIDGNVVGDSVIYYDDSTHRYYVCPIADIDELCALMASADEDVSRDAYSHWCAGCNHGDGFETYEEAKADGLCLGSEQ